MKKCNLFKLKTYKKYKPFKTYNMYCITLHDTETEEIIGMVAPVKTMNFPDFEKLIRESWTAFQPYLHDELESDYSIEDYVEWHNENYEVKIDWVLNEFIKL